VNAVATDLIDEAAEKGRAAFMQAQALASAAERAFTAILCVRHGSASNVPDLRAAASALGTTCRDAEAALREARESADRLLDALGADACARVAAPAQTRTTRSPTRRTAP
jgi:uncharacterized protein YggE